MHILNKLFQTVHGSSLYWAVFVVKFWWSWCSFKIRRHKTHSCKSVLWVSVISAFAFLVSFTGYGGGGGVVVAVVCNTSLNLPSDKQWPSVGFRGWFLRQVSQQHCTGDLRTRRCEKSSVVAVGWWCGQVSQGHEDQRSVKLWMTQAGRS